MRCVKDESESEGCEVYFSLIVDSPAAAEDPAVVEDEDEVNVKVRRSVRPSKQ